MKHIDSPNHVHGRSEYIDDIPLPPRTVHVEAVLSPMAHGHLRQIDSSAAEALPGVIAVFTAGDIPGLNQIGGIIPDEPLLAEGDVHFQGQVVALVVSRDPHVAKAARALVKQTIDPLPVITEPRDAARQKSFLIPPVELVHGDPEAALQEAHWVFTGKASVCGQEHLYLEPQGAIAVPREGGAIHIISSTQGPTAVQRMAAQVLGLPMHQVSVEVRRLGGAFGGKEDQATPWAVMAALVAHKLQRPARMVLDRHDDMRMTGKRHPYEFDFTIGLDRFGKVLAYMVTLYQNGGAAADLSPAVLSRSIFHATNAYAVPHVRVLGLSCKTHLPPNTAFRGFGGPQGMFAFEAALRAAAEGMGIEVEELQRRNLLQDGGTFPYGQPVRQAHARATWERASAPWAAAQERVNAFNAGHHAMKKGLSLMPVCFGISFTKTPMNQATALIHIYHDGSVSVCTGAVEMGQGVQSKIVGVVSVTLGIGFERIRWLSTNTERNANTSPTAASAGADLNGRAAQKAAGALRQRLLQFVASERGPANYTIEGSQVLRDGQPCDLSWDELAGKAHLGRVPLSEMAHYATPEIWFNPETGKGHPFAYHVYGTALTEVTVDCLRGRYTIDEVSICHDFGQPFATEIDIGQVEGGLCQGIGWMTLEELRYNAEGRLLSDTLSTYKVPDFQSAPQRIHIEALPDSVNPLGLMNGKAVGEPPLMYGIGTFFALRHAIRAYRPHALPECHAPLTPERVLMALAGRSE